MPFATQKYCKPVHTDGSPYLHMEDTNSTHCIVFWELNEIKRKYSKQCLANNKFSINISCYYSVLKQPFSLERLLFPSLPTERLLTLDGLAQISSLHFFIASKLWALCSYPLCSAFHSLTQLITSRSASIHILWGKLSKECDYITL